MDTINDRIRILYKKECGSIPKFADKLNVSSDTLKNIISRGISPNFDILNAIAKHFPSYSMDWLISGKGEPYTNTNKEVSPYDLGSYQNSTLSEPISEYLPTSNFKLIPLHSFDVVGGSNNQESDTMGYIMGYIPFVNAKNDDIAVLVTGNSMYPTYPAGSYVQIRKIIYWKEFLEFGQVHIIELMDNRRLIKEVRKGSDKNHLRLISHNENFDEVEISIDFIRSVWLVLAKYEKSVM